MPTLYSSLGGFWSVLGTMRRISINMGASTLTDANSYSIEKVVHGGIEYYASVNALQNNE